VEGPSVIVAGDGDVAAVDDCRNGQRWPRIQKHFRLSLSPFAQLSKGFAASGTLYPPLEVFVNRSSCVWDCVHIL
jgi:hypothetical protein